MPRAPRPPRGAGCAPSFMQLVLAAAVGLIGFGNVGALRGWEYDCTNGREILAFGDSPGQAPTLPPVADPAAPFEPMHSLPSVSPAGRPLIFIHLPKCAGTSVRAALVKRLAPEFPPHDHALCIPYTQPCARGPVPLAVVAGHFQYQLVVQVRARASCCCVHGRVGGAGCLCPRAPRP